MKIYVVVILAYHFNDDYTCLKSAKFRSNCRLVACLTKICHNNCVELFENVCLKCAYSLKAVVVDHSLASLSFPSASNADNIYFELKLLNLNARMLKKQRHINNIFFLIEETAFTSKHIAT